jgi:hypothetical protein
MSEDTLRDLYSRQCEELAATHPDWDALEVAEIAVQVIQ